MHAAVRCWCLLVTSQVREDQSVCGHRRLACQPAHVRMVVFDVAMLVIKA
jgi:hypothetical protein